MGIGLVADVPDQLVAGGVEHGVDRNRQFDHAESGTQMAAGCGYFCNGVAPEFVSQANQVCIFKPADLVRAGDAVQYWCRVLRF